MWYNNREKKTRFLQRLGYKSCLICRFGRVIEVAHRIPFAQGGESSLQNSMLLCPNHHTLFDQRKLTEKEAQKLEKVLAEVGLDYRHYIMPTKKKVTPSV